MTVERRAHLRTELRDAVALLGTMNTMLTDVDSSDGDELRAAKLLLERQLGRIDELLLDITRDRLNDERRGIPPDD